LIRRCCNVICFNHKITESLQLFWHKFGISQHAFMWLKTPVQQSHASFPQTLQPGLFSRPVFSILILGVCILLHVWDHVMGVLYPSSQRHYRRLILLLILLHVSVVRPSSRFSFITLRHDTFIIAT
jgi:hypothetical protein